MEIVSFALGDHIKFCDRIIKAINTLLFLILLVEKIVRIVVESVELGLKYSFCHFCIFNIHSFLVVQ